MMHPMVVIIQARMGSSRLPAKVLSDLEGETMIGRVVRRVRRATGPDRVVVAIPRNSSDDTLAELCHSRNWPFFRGSEKDVLDRFYGAARENGAAAVVRVTSDCPLIDPGIIDTVVNLLEQGDWDYVSNILEPRTFPRGLDVEAFTMAALRVAWKEDANPDWREHVTPYFYRNPRRFRLRGVQSTEDYSEMRWTVDTPEDLELVRRIYRHFGDDAFAWTDVLQVLKEHPEWLDLNRDVPQKAVK